MSGRGYSYNSSGTNSQVISMIVLLDLTMLFQSLKVDMSTSGQPLLLS